MCIELPYMLISDLIYIFFRLKPFKIVYKLVLQCYEFQTYRTVLYMDPTIV